MKKTLQIILLLLAIPFSAKAGTSEGSPLTSMDRQIQTGPASFKLISMTSSGSQRTESAAIWPFKPKYNQNRIQRKNTPARKNRRNKTLLRKWGLGMIEMEVNYG